MSARSKARKRALDILFSADLRQLPIAVSLAAEADRAQSEPDRENSWLYARDIVDGVIERGAQIDETIAGVARGWTLERMPAVDRAILRCAVWELLFNDEVPAGVVISEAVDLATSLSTDDSGSFVNGVLSAIAKSSS
jgi:N utilization substance protein B